MGDDCVGYAMAKTGDFMVLNADHIKALRNIAQQLNKLADDLETTKQANSAPQFDLAEEQAELFGYEGD